MNKHWKITYRSLTSEIFGTITDATLAVYDLARQSGDDPAWLGAYGAEHGYKGFCYYQCFDLVSTGSKPDEKNVGRFEEFLKYN